MTPVQQVDNWPAEVLKAALVDYGELTAEQAQAVRQFIHRIGGIENALLAIDLLVELEDGWAQLKRTFRKAA
jgi:hypothetical protein